MDPKTRRGLLWLSVFTIAMAQLEATVVVYLRELYYPEGFRFPLVILRDRIALIEIAREAATVFMLLGVAKLFAARDSWRQFAAFLFAFGAWDILYYVWLFVFLRWPSHLLEWDVLFLIPAPWIGPVLAPILISLVMILASLAILQLRDQGRQLRVRAWEWALVVLAAVGMIALFLADAAAVSEGRLPAPFRWLPFLALLGLGSACAWLAWRRSWRSAPEPATVLQSEHEL